MMSLPYENAISGGKALSNLNAILNKLGCSRFGTMTDADKGELVVQFSYKDRDVSARVAIVATRPHG